MRAVALSDKTVQAKVAESFIPLKVVIPYGSKTFPLDWPAMSSWRTVHRLMGGDECQGLTGCSVISTDLTTEYANTGSAFVWEMFESTAYDAEKFAAMLDRGLERSRRERAIRDDPALGDQDRARRLARFHQDVRRAVAEEGRGRPQPKGFNNLNAVQIFGLTGDLFARPPK